MSEVACLYARRFSGPMQYQTFLKSAKQREKYWARNFSAWPVFSKTLPNDVHKIIPNWEHSGRIFYTITQNVDILHTKAGANKVVELHGNTHKVVCLNCNFNISRHDFQDILTNLNIRFSSEIDYNSINPDGDIILDDEIIKAFNFTDCPHCNGILKPDVIFFGDNLPRSRKEFISRLVHSCDGLLCIGCSLTVLSSFRIVKECHELNKRIGIINVGNTRGDSLGNIKLKGRLGYVFPKIDDIISAL